MKNNLKISVVTVCYNAVDTIEKTILSVLNQSYTNIEYIIIDGGSTDGTVDVIKKYADRLAYWISEPDRGIYDAMNKGIDIVTGEYINFMNSGDEFYDSNVISLLFNKPNNADVIYGDTYIILPNYKFRNKNRPLSEFNRTLPFGHQSTFAKSSLMKKFKFDTSFKSAADYYFLYNLYKDGFKFKYVPLLVSKFDGYNGFSAKNIKLVRKEIARVNGDDKKAFWKYKYLINYGFYVLKQRLKKILPKRLVNRINIYNINRNNY